jgi:hypothetical protein
LSVAAWRGVPLAAGQALQQLRLQCRGGVALNAQQGAHRAPARAGIDAQKSHRIQTGADHCLAQARCRCRVDLQPDEHRMIGRRLAPQGGAVGRKLFHRDFSFGYRDIRRVNDS